MLLPFKSGVSKSKVKYGEAAGGRPLQLLKSGSSLNDLTKDYVLFTYAPLFLYGGLEHNPVQEWLNLTNYGQVVFILPLEDEVVELGAGDKFNKLLWACQKDVWPSLAAHISNMAFLNRDKKTLARVICQSIEVLDKDGFNNTLRSEKIPKVSIITFSPESNSYCLAFKASNNLLKYKPELTPHTIRSDTVKLAKELLSDSSDPYKFVQPLPPGYNNET